LFVSIKGSRTVFTTIILEVKSADAGLPKARMKNWGAEVLRITITATAPAFAPGKSYEIANMLLLSAI
jgi:hypothetical protein